MLMGEINDAVSVFGRRFIFDIHIKCSGFNGQLKNFHAVVVLDFTGAEGGDQLLPDRKDLFDIVVTVSCKIDPYLGHIYPADCFYTFVYILFSNTGTDHKYNFSS